MSHYERLNDDENWKKIFQAANEAYPDGFLSTVWEDFLTGNETSVGDTLAEFIVRELADTFDPDSSFKDQCEEAARVMVNAKNEVLAVYEAVWLLGISEKPETETVQ